MPVKQVNILTNIAADADDNTFRLEAGTALPASPMLAIFCCNPIREKTPVRRYGQNIMHGNKLFFPCPPTLYPPNNADGQEFTWALGADAISCSECNYVIVQQQAAPFLDWHSQAYQCPPKIPKVGTWRNRWSTSYGVPPDSDPDPALVAYYTDLNNRDAFADEATGLYGKVQFAGAYWTATGRSNPDGQPGFDTNYADITGPSFEAPTTIIIDMHGGYTVLFYYALFKPA